MTSSVPVRPRVVDRVAQARERRLTVVAASAGFGKTTALATLDAECWLDLTSADRDVLLLANRLAVALGIVAAGMRATGTGPDNGAEFAESRAAEICAALAERDHTVIVFDGVELLGRDASKPAWRLLQTLAVQAPAGVHVVLSGRRMPPDRVLSGSGRDADVVGESDLAFTVEEIGELLGQAGSDPGAVADKCLAVSGGWPAAVQLTVEHMRTERGAAGVTAAGRGRWRSVARTVFAAEPAEMRRVLGAVALIGAVDQRLLADLGDGFSGVGLAGLALLSERGLLVADGRSGYLRLSPAMVGVVTPAAEDGPVRARAAASLERAGQWERALAQHVELGASSVRQLLREHGPLLVDAWLSGPVCDALRAVGTGGEPQLEMLRGQALQALGDLDRASEVLHGVRERLGDRGFPAAIAWRYASLQYWRGETQAALAALVAAEPATNATDEALVAAWHSSCLWATGRPADAQTWTERALARALESQDAAALAAAHTASGLVAGAAGDSDANEREQRLALPWAVEAGDRMQEVRIRANLTACAAFRGDYSLSATHAERAVLAARGYTVLTGHALSNQAAGLVMLGQLDEARAASAEALEYFARIGPTMSGAAHLDIAQIDRERGDLVRAQLSAERSLRLSDQIGDAHTAASALAFLACTIAADDPDSARTLARRSIELASEMERSTALAAAAWVELADHQPDLALQHATAAEAAAAEINDLARVANSSVLIALAADPPDVPRLDRTLATWRALGNVVEVLRCRLLLARCRDDSAEQRIVAAELTARGLAINAGACALPLRGVPDRADLQILTLGVFHVVRGRDVVPVTEWQSRKARELLQLLIARRGRPITREALSEMLWPGESGGQTGNRLSVLLSTVRRVLDPDRAHDADYFLRAEDNAIGLRVERIQIDVIELFEAVRDGMRLIRDGLLEEGEAVLRHAEQLYRGDFLAENPYADWAIDCRSEALEAAQTLLRHLAGTETARGEHEAALDHLRRLLERDRYDEQAWVAFIGALLRLRRHGEARRQHASYARLMDELDVAPIPIDQISHAL